MLDVMRRGAQNIVVKSFLGLLALSFVIWGVGDVFRGSSGANTIATIDDAHISYDEYNNNLRRELAKYQQITGKTLTDEQINQFGIKEAVLNTIVDGRIIRKRMEDLRFKVGDAAGSDQIFSNPAFFDESGKFSNEQFDAIMKANGLTKKYYLESVKVDTAIRLFIETMLAKPKTMAIQAEALYAHRSEQRVADLLYIPADYIKAVAEPSETDLVQYYQDNSAKFTIPETRDATYMTLNVSNVKDDIKLTDEELKAEYDANISSYQDAEKRSVTQYLFNTEAEAKAALEEIRKGKTSSYDSNKTDLGDVTRDSLPGEVQNAVFGLEKNVYSEPVSSPMGWHIFTVKNVVVSHTQPFAQVKKSIEEHLKEAKAAEQFTQYANQIEDDFASGMSLEDVAKKHKLKVTKISAVDMEGKANGKEADLPEREVFVPLVFKTDSGSVSPLTLLSDGYTYAAIRVDAVSPQREKALDEVKGIAIAMWKEQAKETKLKQAAEEIATKAQTESVNKLSDSLKLKLVESKTISRPADLDDEEKEILPHPLTKQLFALKVGHASGAYKTSDGSFVIAKLKDIKESPVQKTKLLSIENSLKDDFSEDILAQYNTYLRKEYPVKINESLLKKNEAN
ncbi:MAG: peptidylprolyl isomerase [Rickettsiaceae bacterium]|jgi:peptidyl-prolyl cis-trans isomerase D|nr:peptidylprolyl isomerase [Rickettsiaceae bacterium]